MDKIRLGELFQKLKPRILDLISLSGGGPGPYAPSPHDISGAHHSGSISDAQGPQFAKTDGSRSFTDDITIADGKTVDGVDVSVLGSDYSTHILNSNAHHDAVTVFDSDTIDFGLSGQQVSAAVIVGSGLLDGTGGVRPDWATTASGLNAASTNSSGSASKIAKEDHTHAISALADVSGVSAETLLKSTADGKLTLNGLTLSGDLLPTSPDLVNIGSASYPFLTGHISEMYGQRFVEETIQVAGGHWIIPQSSATLATALDTSTTTMVLTESQSWDAGDYLVMRDISKVEYFKVVSGSGDTWTVERNKDSSGANEWGVGAVMANLGKSGEGWLEAQGGSVPAFSVWRRTGTNYSDVLEVARLGELTSWQSAGLSGPGLGIGSVSGNEYLTYTPTGGLAVRGTIRADDGYLGNLDIDGLLSVSGTSSAISIGSTPPTADDSGTGIWLDRNGLVGLSSGVMQVMIDAVTGSMFAGGGDLVFDEDGITLTTLTSDDPGSASSIKWYYDYYGVNSATIYSWFFSPWAYLHLSAGGSSQKGSVVLKSGGGSSHPYDYVLFAVTPEGVDIIAQNTYGTVDINFQGDLYMEDRYGYGYGNAYLDGVLGLNKKTSYQSAITDALQLHNIKNAPVFLRDDDSKIPITPCPPWEAMRSFSQIIGSYCPLYNVATGGYMKDSSYTERHLTPNPSASTIPLNDDETISDYQIYLRANGTTYYSNTAQGTSRNGASWATILVWFKPTTVGILQGLLQFGHTTQNIAAYITTGNKLVVDFTSTGGVTQVISSNSVNLNAWNYAVLRFQGSGGTSFINLNGTTTSVTSASGNLITAVGEFRYGHQPGYAGYFSGVLGFLTFGDYAATNTYQLWIDMSRPWHGH